MFDNVQHNLNEDAENVDKRFLLSHIQLLTFV